MNKNSFTNQSSSSFSHYCNYQYLFPIIALFLLLNVIPISCPVQGQTNDSLQIQKQTTQTDSSATRANDDLSSYEGTDDFSPGLLFFAVIGFAFILMSVGAGIALTILGILIIFGLITTGILSASIIVGLNKKSFMKGFKTFLVSATTVGGIIIGAISFWLINKISHWWTLKTVLIAGSISGLIAGLILGFLAFFLIKKLTAYLKNRIQTNQNQGNGNNLTKIRSNKKGNH